MIISFLGICVGIPSWLMTYLNLLPAIGLESVGMIYPNEEQLENNIAKAQLEKLKKDVLEAMETLNKKFVAFFLYKLAHVFYLFIFLADIGF